MSRVLVLLADGFEDVEAVTAIDVLRRGGAEVLTASIGETPEVHSAHGIVMRADALFADVADRMYEAILLPGGGEGVERMRVTEPVLERLRRQNEEGGWLCAICAGPLVLQAAGVLDAEQHVTCYPTCAMEMNSEVADGVPVVVDGNVITGQAPGSSLLFALVVLQKLESDSAARRVARGLVTDVL